MLVGRFSASTIVDIVLFWPIVIMGKGEVYPKWKRKPKKRQLGGMCFM